MDKWISLPMALVVLKRFPLMMSHMSFVGDLSSIFLISLPNISSRKMFKFNLSVLGAAAKTLI